MNIAQQNTCIVNLHSLIHSVINLEFLGVIVGKFGCKLESPVQMGIIQRKNTRAITTRQLLPSPYHCTQFQEKRRKCP